MDKINETIVATYDDLVNDAEKPRPSIRVGAVAEALRGLLVRRVAALVPRVHVVEFHAFREAAGLPADATSTLATNAFIDQFGPEEVARWFDSYPVLGDLLGRVATNSANFLTIVADRLVADREALVGHGLVGAHAGDVVRLETYDSDPHKGGTLVVGVDFESGERLVYKPRGMAGEEILRACLQVLEDDLDLDLAGCVPRALDRGTYGWQEHVVGAPARRAEDAVDYYWRFGALASLLGVIGATDLHEENVVARGDRPVLIDLETMLHADNELASTGLPDVLGDRVRISVANTLLFPQRMPSGPYSVVLGGLGIPYQQESSRTDFVVVDPGTDAVDIARRTYPFLRRQHVLAGPDGQAASALDHYPALVEGYVAGYRAVLAHRDQILALLESRPFRLRQILRSTGSYARLLSAATHPDQLRSWERFEAFLKRIQPPFGLKLPQVVGFLDQAEQASLAEGDIPYFSVDSDDYRLVVDGDERSVPFTDHTPLERARLGLAAMEEDRLAFDLLLIEDGMSELRRLSPETPVQAPALVRSLLEWPHVRDLLGRVAVSAPGSDGVQRGWITGLTAEALPTYDIGSAVSFHDAGGIGVFLRRCADPASESDQAELAAIDRGQDALVRRYRESLEQLPLSVISGLASLAYRNSLADPAGLAPAMTALLEDRRWQSTWSERRAAHDLTRGLPGVGMVLASSPEADPAVVADLLRETASPPASERAAHDLAHGELGVAWARYRMARRVGDVASVQRATRTVLDIADQPVPATHRGWCSGAAAITLALAESIDDHGDAARVRRMAELAVTPGTDGGPIDLSVCHGAAGIVQVLVEVAQRLDESWPLDLAADFWARTRTTADVQGLFTGDRAKTAVLGYFHGWAGIADSTLLLERALAGEQPWVPIALTAPEAEEGVSS